jgi:PAS domain S-box-containing protein
MGFSQQLLSSDFMPHGFCYLWDPRIVWLHVISDGLIALSYYCIPLILIYFTRKNRDRLFNRIFWLFGGFILACGTSHLMEIWNVWHGSYLIAGVVKAITAAISVLTAAMLIPLVQRVMSLPGRLHLDEVNRRLEREIAEHKRAEEMRERLAAVVESSDDAILSKNLEGTITSWNLGAEKVFGYPAVEAVGKPMLMLFPAERGNEESDILARIRRGESVDHFETVRIRKDGKRIDVSVTISPIRDSGGAIVGASKVARDITERKHAEAALRESENRFRTLIEQASDAFFLHDSAGRFLEVNRQACESLGYTREELLRMCVLDVEQDFDLHKAQQAWEQFEPGKAYTLQGHQRRKDGTAFPVEIRLSSYYVDGQRLHLGLARDITERKRAEEALRQSDARRKFALETAKLGDWELDLTTLQATRSLLHDQIFGYQSLLPEWSFDIFLGHVHPDDRERVRENFQSCVSQGKRWQFECRIVCPNGDLRWIWACGNHYRESSGDATHMFGIVQDITERKQAEEALRESEENYRTLFEFMDEGFCTIEVLFDEKNEPVDYRFLDVNPAFEKHTGIPNARGRRMLEIAPRHEDYWFEVYGKIALTGEPARFENQAAQLHRWYDIHAFRVGKPQEKKVAVLFNDITGRRSIEEALRTSEEKLRLAVEGAGLGTWHWNLETGELVWSPKCLALFGQPPDTKMSYEIFLGALHPEDRAGVDEAVRKSLAEHSEYNIECRTVWPDATEHWIASRGRGYYDANGRAIRMEGIALDVTERRAAQESLRESEKRFQAMANGIPQLAWMADADGHIFWYNQRWYEYTGTTFEQMEGWAWQSVHDPAVLPQVLERWGNAIATGKPFDMEFPLRGADGHFRMFLTRVMPVRDTEGHVTRWFGTNTDISERKQNEERLADQAEELGRQAGELARSRQALERQTLTLQSVLNSMAEGLSALDENGKLIIWNKAAERILGPGATDLAPEKRPEHFGAFLPDTVTLLPHEQSPMTRALRGESLTAELFVRSAAVPNGVWLEASAEPMRDEAGVVRGGVVAFRDITQRKSDEHKIRQLNDELEIRVLERTAELQAANQELEAFSYSVSHDLRAPLRHISGFSQMLVEEFGPTLDAGARHYLDRIQAGTQKMGLLVDELLNLAKVGRHALRRQPAGLDAMVAEVIAMLQPDCEGRGVEWAIADLPQVECDPVLVRQIFQNLLANALKFTRPRTRAVIEVSHSVSPEEENGQPVFMVRDNGIGFDMKYVAKLFGVFQRLHRPEDFEGTGIGLATVQRIVHKHGGRVWVEAEPDKGAAFYFTLGVGKKAESKRNGAMAGGQS